MWVINTFCTFVTHSLPQLATLKFSLSHSVQHSFHHFFIHHRKAVPTSAFNQPPKPQIVRYLSLLPALPFENTGQIGKSQFWDKNNSEEQQLCLKHTQWRANSWNHKSMQTEEKVSKSLRKKYLGEHHILPCFAWLSFTLRISSDCESLQRVS